MTDLILKEVKDRLAIKEDFQKAEKGTRSQVLLSKNFVIKINRDLTILKNESEVLKTLVLDVAPNFLAFYTIQNYGVLVEQKIKGRAIDDAWKNIEITNKKRIATDIVEAIHKINQQKKDYFWSAQFDVKFRNYKDLLFHKFKLNEKKIFDNQLAHKLFLEISSNIDERKVERIFGQTSPVLLHGDLIMHNLLTDLYRLTGILDWEYAQFGDSFYDLARIMYYQECAKAYVDEQRDEHFEYDFTTRLIEQLKQLIDFNLDKYMVIRSFFFVDTIIWALGSADPEKNLAGLQTPRF
ncbi:MAG: phosphotransferase [Patescibacteria group bacterium]